MSRVVVFDEFGGPEVLRIVTEPIVEPTIGEVRVRIEAFAINPLDAMIRAGKSQAPVVLPHVRLGIEATGVIDAVGPDVVGREVGEPVIITAIPDSNVRGSYAEHTTVPASRVIRRPEGLGTIDAAAIWVGYATAYGALVEAPAAAHTVGLQAGNQVLIAGASGAVGRAAIQLANQFGAVPLAMTRDSSKREELLAAGAAAVIATDHEDVVAAVARHTGGALADITLDLVRGPAQQSLLKATRPGGTLVAAGFLDPRPTPEPRDGPVAVVNYRGFDYLRDPAVVERIADSLKAGLRHGVLKPAIDTVFAFEEVVAAHRRFDEGLHAGKKIVVTVAR